MNSQSPNATSRPWTQQERDVLSIMPGMLSEMQDILTDLTTEPPSQALRSRMRQLAARSLLRDLREYMGTINAMFAAAPVLSGTIADDETP